MLDSGLRRPSISATATQGLDVLVIRRRANRRRREVATQ